MPLDQITTSLPFSEAFVHYTLFAAMLALGAAFVFFLMERDKINPAYKGVMTTSAILCGVAAVAYYYLTTGYNPSSGFPTDIRYIDWTVTTPLLLVKYPELLRVRGFKFGAQLIAADLWMIVTGFIGELYGTTQNGVWQPHSGVYLWGVNATTAHYVWGLISTLGYAYIVYVLLFGEGKRLALNAPAPIQNGIKVMNRYILIGWGVYPIVYILEGMSATNPNINLDWGQSVSAVADVVNKVCFGLTAYFAVKAVSGDNQYSPERQPT